MRLFLRAPDAPKGRGLTVALCASNISRREGGIAAQGFCKLEVWSLFSPAFGYRVPSWSFIAVHSIAPHEKNKKYFLKLSDPVRHKELHAGTVTSILSFVCRAIC